MYCKAHEILRDLPDEEKKKLKLWAFLDSIHAVSANSIGQNLSEMERSEKAWDDLSRATQKIYKKKILPLHYKCVEEALEAAADELGVDQDLIDTNFALGDNYPLGEYISMQDF